MSATTAALPPSPQAWSPSITATAVSTTPLGMPPRTPTSVGQMTAPMLGSGATLSPRMLRDSCNSYFGIVDFSSANPPSSTPGIHARRAWNFPSGSPHGGKHGNRHNSSEYNFEYEAFRKQSESAGFIAGHRISSSFEKQTQALRDRDRRAEERRDMRSPASPHAADSYMSIDPHPSGSIGEVKSGTTFVKPMNPSIAQSPASTIPHVRTPLDSEVGNGHPSYITLSSPHSRHSLSVNRARPLQRSETSPASIDQGNIQFMAPCRCAELSKSASDTTLLLDVRPYPQFTDARIKGALNLCIPTTLLKRPSFNLKKLEDTFAGDEEKKRFARWQQCTRIIVYDSSTIHTKDASTLINVLKKFTNEGWKGEPSILRGGFKQFSSEFPDLIESTQDNGLASFARQPRSIKYGSDRRRWPNTYQLAEINVWEDSTKVTAMARAGADVQDKGKSISDKFLQIERAEQARMREALTGDVSYGSPGAGSPKKTFRIAGLEKGSKNRYNNIYPYDHSRVRLQGVPNGACDYVNASFIQSSLSNKKYIATQAPIPATFNDFWRVVWEQDIRVIVMLTAESEGPQLKCHPYWKAAEYGPLKVKTFSERRIPLSSSASSSSSPQTPQPQLQQQQSRPSGERRSTNPLTQFEKFDAKKDTQNANSSGTEQHDIVPHATVRHLTLAHTAFPFQPIREITQIQYSHWPDFGTPAEPAHLLRLIEEVNQIAHTANRRAVVAGGDTTTTLDPAVESQRRILVHCSAGCGRTGTYCTVDSVVDMLKKQRRAAAAAAMAEGSNGRSNNDDCSSSGGGGDDDWLRREDIDLIAATVEEFRLQRLSMVQSLKQFVLCYESVLEWIALHEGEQLGQVGEGGDANGVGSKSGFRRSLS
ncbi:hypothetical protein ACJ72_06668 [Emergomyces africanus]|uniref:protein-tyrosine-phosphatase n=1 Tax=Emergomyces africanus TaxID=1955775 RepID=A0A1B7NQR3_9EURO|nr:hypothetical protein ACJ72_06668 [Emergomyces africanus]